MSDFFSEQRPPKRVLIIKLRHHGDVLLTSPVFTVMKKNWPDAEVDALVYDDTQAMLTSHPYINQVHTIGRQWRKKGWLAQFRLYRELLNTLKARQYDVLINLTEHWHGARLARRLKPRVSVGFKPDKRSGLARSRWVKSFTTLYPAIQDNSRHMVEVNLDALRRIGIHPQNAADKNTLFVPGEAAEKSIAEKLDAFGLSSKSYILVHPTSRWMFKAWQIDKLARTIDTLAARGLPVILSAAPSKEETAYMNELRAALTQPVFDLSGQLNLKELGALMKHARLYFGVDSMPMHLASAVGTPTVAIFGPTGAIKWSPWGVPYRVITAGFTCQPCGKAGCGDSQVSDCITAITPQQVLSAIDTLLLESP
ncbi:putative lipopolysaccharide heptosyltransferase III [Klebsiella aerogenes]|uniref:putative lipopolysaccharide heptosyltransferase III n=1 Tax=Klebsiella aerogenes TaxID=548 RepID=UPI003A4DC1D6